MTTDQEKIVLDRLADAWNEYVKLPTQHPCDAEEFMHAIHAAQGIIATRVARTTDPATWPTRGAE